MHSGEVWPGPCVFPDFTQSKVRSWWANLVTDFISNGVDGIWNDMNEPAVFKVSNERFPSDHSFFFFLIISFRKSHISFLQSVTKTMPETNIHKGDCELGGVQNHLHYHNVCFSLPILDSFFIIMIHFFRVMSTIFCEEIMIYPEI